MPDPRIGLRGGGAETNQQAQASLRRSSASSQGRQAAISREFGFLWMRRLPRGSHLKCFTVFVT